MIGGSLAAYFLGLLVEYEWGTHVSLVIFLVLYFFFLWVSWVLAVWVTTPKDTTQRAT
jgi:membrane protein implicated in regulation of membrane protease activity